MQKEHPDHQHEPVRKSHEAPQETLQHDQPTAQRYNDKEAHQAAEDARHEAIHSKVQGKEKRVHQAEQHNKSHGLHASDRDESFEETMDQVRQELPRSSRPLSRFIHRPAIERLSEVLGKTLFRPNAILAGGVTAFVGVLGLYFYAKYMSFSLQGSETIIAFAVGWIAGILFDFFKTMFTGSKQ